MILSAHLKNFQAHEDSYLEFDKGINTIIGTSDHGKSSIIRALCLARYNRPSGTSYIRRGSGENGKLGTTEITIKARRLGQDTIHTVQRIRGQTKNAIVCDDHAFPTVGKDIPEEVIDALGLNEINIQKQFDGAFLLFASPGTVAETLNRFSKLDRVDAIVDGLQSDILEETRNLASLENGLALKKDKVKSYDWLTGFTVLVEDFEEQETSVKDLMETINALNKAIQELNRIKEEKEEVQRKKDSCKRKAETLRAALTQALELQTQYRAFDNELSLDMKIQKVLQSAERDLIRIQRKKRDLLNERPLVENELKEKRVELTKALEHCPYCAQELDDQARATLLRNL